jgi:hypothetical protein
MMFIGAPVLRSVIPALSAGEAGDAAGVARRKAGNPLDGRSSDTMKPLWMINENAELVRLAGGSGLLVQPTAELGPGLAGRQGRNDIHRML